MSSDCPLFLILKRYKHHCCRYIRTMVGLCVKNGDKKLRSTFAGSTFPSAGSSFNGIARHHRGLLVITLNGEDAAVLEFLQSKSHNQSLTIKVSNKKSKSYNQSLGTICPLCPAFCLIYGNPGTPSAVFDSDC